MTGSTWQARPSWDRLTWELRETLMHRGGDATTPGRGTGHAVSSGRTVRPQAFVHEGRSARNDS